MKPLLQSTLFVVTLFICLGASISLIQDEDQPAVQTPFGNVTGLINQTNGVRSFCGVPYAEPPINELRWKAPKSFFFGAVNATAFSPKCPQMGAFAVYSRNETESEDCLYLNIWVPPSASSSSLLPVKVWIHGGGYTSGTGADYDGTTLSLLTNTIVVTFNYRLGIFGFWSSSGLVAENPSLNFGLQDQQLALRWISSTIGAFGGDNQNILLFGESAGGGSVFSHLFYSAELFAKAIMESPGPWKLLYLQDAVQTNDRAILPPCNSAGSPSSVLACLRSLNTSMVMRTVVGYPIPVVDGKTILDQPFQMLQNYHERVQKDIPVLLGNNLYEGTVFSYDEFHTLNVSLPLIMSQLNTWVLPPYVMHNRSAVAEVFSSYEAIGNATGNWFTALSDLYADQYIDCGVAFFSDSVSKMSSVYRYRFDHATVDWELSFLNATHSIELAYIWQNGFLESNLNEEEMQLSSDLISYWNNFHLTGNPNTDGVSPSSLLPLWPQYNGANVITFDTQRNYSLVSHPESDRCEAIWYSVLSLP